jgi:hypothetical protein
MAHETESHRDIMAYSIDRVSGMLSLQPEIYMLIHYIREHRDDIKSQMEAPSRFA